MNGLLEHPAVQAGGLPFAVALAIAWPLARTRWLALAWAGGVAVLLALTVGFEMQPLTAVRKAILLMLAALLVSLAVEATGVGRRRATVAALSLAAALGSVWVLWRLIAQAEGGAGWGIAIGAAVYVAALGASALGAGGDPLRAALAGTMLGLGSGLIAILGASAFLGLLGLTIGVACAAIALVQIVRGPAPAGWTLAFPAAVGAALVGVLTVTTGQGRAYPMLPLLLVAPLAAWAGRGEPRPWPRALRQGLAALLPMVVAVGWAWFDASASAAGG